MRAFPIQGMIMHTHSHMLAHALDSFNEAVISYCLKKYSRYELCVFWQVRWWQVHYDLYKFGHLPCKAAIADVNLSDCSK